ncbi:hypothetical protein LCGC14_0536030 [marine sediment metagenome]|uniref:Nuclease associated modular domain-containing protein n=1 Tax=marine sediment metagenome TaxID=412755 RepID=A0A0F9UFK7_9ZZZZ
MPDMKICNGPCNRELPLSEFYRKPTAKDGYGGKCKGCLKKYYQTNRDKILQRNKKYYRRPEIAAQHEEYYQKNRDRYIRRSKEHYATLKGRLRFIFHCMNGRCNNPDHKFYKYYGGRGILNKFKTLNEFWDHVINDLGIASVDQIQGLQIDRIDNDGHYEKGNIRFVTAKVNIGNRGSYRKQP